MPVILSERNADLVEFMDRDDCDLELLENTYQQFSVINSLISGWKGIYQKEIKPLLRKGEITTLLDIGFGGGDIPQKLSKWAKEDGYKLQLTAIETDERAVQYVEKSGQKSESVSFRHCASGDLVEEGRIYDIVISNHLIHHLSDAELLRLLQEAEQLARQKVIFSDIERSDIGFALFSGIAEVLFRNSYIVKDGRISIRRSFTQAELASLVPENWTVKRQFPFRLQLNHEISQ